MKTRMTFTLRRRDPGLPRGGPSAGNLTSPADPRAERSTWR